MWQQTGFRSDERTFNSAPGSSEFESGGGFSDKTNDYYKTTEGSDIVSI